MADVARETIFTFLLRSGRLLLLILTTMLLVRLLLLLAVTGLTCYSLLEGLYLGTLEFLGLDCDLN